MSRIRTLVVFVIIGLSALVVLDNTQGYVRYKNIAMLANTKAFGHSRSA